MGKVTRQSIHVPLGQTLYLCMAIVTCCCMVLSVGTFLEAVLIRVGRQTMALRFPTVYMVCLLYDMTRMASAMKEARSNRSTKH